MRVEYETRELADLFGVSEKAIRNRAAREKWRHREEPNPHGGGDRKIWLSESFPSRTRMQIEELEGIGDESIELDGEAARIWAGLDPREQGLALARLQVLRAADIYMSKGGRRAGKVELLVQFYDRLDQAIKERREGRLEELGISRESIPGVLEHIKRVSEKSHYRWVASYEEAREKHGFGVIGLVKKRREAPGLGALKMAPDMVAYSRKLITSRQVKLLTMRKSEDGRMLKVSNTAGMYRRLEARYGRYEKGGVLPHYAHFTKWLNQYLMEQAESLSAVCLPSFHLSNFAMRAGCASEDVSYAGQRWEMDGTKADVMLKDGRYDLVVAIDVFSRDWVFGLERNASSITVVRVIAEGIMRWGVPETITTDRGLIFQGKHIQAACGSLETKIDLCDGYAPHQKPHVERCIGTISRMLFESLTWYVGHNPGERKRIEEYDRFNQVFYHKQGEKISCAATAEELKKLIGEWLEKVYRVELHSFADLHLGRSRRVLDRLSRSPRRAKRIVKAETLDDLLAPRIDRVFNSGIVWLNETYLPVDIPSWERAQKYAGRKVAFRPSLSDASRASMWEILADDKIGDVICYLSCEKLGGMSLDEYMKARHTIEKEHKKRRKAIEEAFPPRRYEDELEEMPEPKLAVANFGAAEFDGRSYRDVKNFSPSSIPRKPPGLSDEEKERLRLEIKEKEAALADTPPRIELVVEKEEGDEGGEFWSEVRALEEAERYEKILECEAREMLIPRDLKSDARYFEQSEAYSRLKGYFEDKKAIFAALHAR